MKRSRTILISLVLFLSTGTDSSGQQPADVAFNHVTILEGLANNRVDCMLQDHEGYLWFGTKRGLCRYNGYEFKIFHSQPGDTSSLRYHQISSLWEDPDHTLWIGTTGGGLHYYDRTKETFTFVDILPGEITPSNPGNITAIIPFSQNEIWVVHSQGLTHIDRVSKKAIALLPIDSPLELPGHITSVFRDGSGMLFIAIQDRQLLYNYNFDNKQIKPLLWSHKAGPLPGVIHQFYTYDENNLWMATDQGLFNFNKQTRKIEPVNRDLAPGAGTNLSFIQEDDSRNLWMGGDGLFFFDRETGRFRAFHSDPGNPETIEGNILTCGLKDSQHNLWFGTFSRGVNVHYYKTKQFNPDQLLTALIENLSKNITAICKSIDGMLFLGTWDKGLLVIDKRNRQVNLDHTFPRLGFLRERIIRSIVRDKNGKIWIGTNDGLLVEFDQRQRSVERYEIESENDKAITTILFTSREQIWTGGDAGVMVLDRETGTFKELEDISRIIPTVLDMAEDSSGNIWVASYANGLFRITPDEEVIQFSQEGEHGSGLPGDKFVTVFKDSRNRIWAGSEFNGLFLYLPDKDRFQQFTVKEGLPSNDICSILEDLKGRLWIGTNNGLSRFNYSLNEFKNYFWSDGMNADEFHYNSNFTDADGLQYFGCTNGMVNFDPDEIRDNRLTYPVKIEEISVNNGSVLNDANGVSVKEALRTGESLRLKHHQNTISFKYTTLNYALAKKSNFAYKLQGFDARYNNVKSQRQVTYTNLSPGKYLFKVIASNNDNVWDEKGAEISFIIKTPPWFTLWAFMIYSALLILIGYVLWHQVRHEQKMKRAIAMERIEKNQQKELTQMKLRFFTNISHEFKSPLTLIIGPLEQLITEQHGNSRLKRRLAQISKNSQRLLELINQLIDFRKMEQDVLPLNRSHNDLVNTVQNTMSMFSHTAVQNEIRFNLNTGFEQLLFNYDGDKVEKVLSNILSNAFKYTPKGGKIVVGIILNEEKNVSITVADSGSGMTTDKLTRIFDRFYSDQNITNADFEKQGSGIGLAYSRKLVELHNGTLQVESVVGEGTTVTIQFPYEEDAILTEKPDSEQSFIAKTDLTEPALPEPEPEPVNAAALPDAPRILIVDDDDELRSYIRSVLKHYYQIDEAVDGEAGLEMALKNDYELIVSDVMMPQLSGTAMCAKIKSNIKTSHILVILLTAKSDIQSEMEGYKTGADSYIGKPFLPQQLSSVIANLLKTRQHIKEYYTSLEERKPEPIGISHQDRTVITKAIRHIEENLEDEAFGVEALGKELGLSRTHLYRKLKSLTGLSANDYIRQIRFKKAAQLLKAGHLSISEVAYEVGCTSPANFSTSFKAIYGISPKAYQGKK
ncbi:MAG: two-component regulator propeller domain-containing protein [Bacteroidota bacterium]